LVTYLFLITVISFHLAFLMSVYARCKNKETLFISFHISDAVRQTPSSYIFYAERTADRSDLYERIIINLSDFTPYTHKKAINLARVGRIASI
jgi:hypothetical protein